MCCSLLVPRSLAVTVTIPFASISKQTSICGTPAFAIGIPSNLNLPIDLLPEAILRSPCNTFTSTIGWLSIDVVNTCFFWHGIVVFASTIGAIISPLVSIPNDNGVTSRSSKSPVELPARISACLAAPNATASSGFTDWFNGLLNSFFNASCNDGIRVVPPTSKIQSISSYFLPAFSTATLAFSTVRSFKFFTRDSNLARESVIARFNGAPSFIEIYGRLISVCVELDNSIFAFSADSTTRA